MQAPLPSDPPPLRPDARGQDGYTLHDVSEWGVEGRGFADVARFYDRLPSRAEQRGARGGVGPLASFGGDADAAS